MNKKIGSLFNWGYFFLIVLLVLTNSNYFGFAICFLTAVGLISRTIPIEMALMVSLALGNEMTCIINLSICVVYIAKIRKLHLSRINASTGFCVLFLLISSIVNMLLNGAFWGGVFAIFYYAIVVFLAGMLKGVLDEKKIIDSLKSLLIIEFCASAINAFLVKSFTPGDFNKGSFSNAHYFTLWLICVLTYIFYYYKNMKYCNSINLKKNSLYYFIGLFLIVMSDGKNVVAGFVVALVVYGISYLFSKRNKNRIIISIALIYFGTVFILLFLHIDIVQSFINSKLSNVSLYLYDTRYSYKLQYFEGTIFEELKGFRTIFGYGLGQYGSRFANLLGYEYMYRDNNFINNFIASHFDSYILPNYLKYASVYSHELMQTIRWRSAVLTYPFSSLIAFLAENGIVGLLLLAYLFGKWADKSKYGIIVVFLFSSCIFDIYFDHIGVLALVLVLVGGGIKNTVDNRSNMNNNM